MKPVTSCPTSSGPREQSVIMSFKKTYFFLIWSVLAHSLKTYFSPFKTSTSTWGFPCRLAFLHLLAPFSSKWDPLQFVYLLLKEAPRGNTLWGITNIQLFSFALLCSSTPRATLIPQSQAVTHSSTQHLGNSTARCKAHHAWDTGGETGIIFGDPGGCFNPCGSFGLAQPRQIRSCKHSLVGLPAQLPKPCRVKLWCNLKTLLQAHRMNKLTEVKSQSKTDKLLHHGMWKDRWINLTSERQTDQFNFRITKFSPRILALPHEEAE